MADSALDFTIGELRNYRASQYVSAVGLVILLWDHLLTFHDEFRFIWRAPASIPKLLFLFNRYTIPTSLIILTYATSGLSDAILSDSFCQTWFGVGVVLGMLSIGTSNFLVLLRLWVLWDRRTPLVLCTLILFVLTQITSVVCTAYVVNSLMPLMVFEPDLHVCLLTKKVDLVLLWSPGVAFELMVFITTCWNALDRPLPQNAKMAKVMYRDGSTYFFVLFGLRLTNLVLSIVSPISLVFLGVFFIWSVCSVTLTRLIINLRRVTVEAEENLIEQIDLGYPHSWPVSPGSCVSESYGLRGKGFGLVP